MTTGGERHTVVVGGIWVLLQLRGRKQNMRLPINLKKHSVGVEPTGEGDGGGTSMQFW
jgi:hypothetical protein